ncbi:hypothetical protein [Effusibacillus lacus]|uniref:Uncharacterized protein n=1 Tax=Effusibacillus lacus TaxID=1348429 RepID=A0A292YN41_9BACL|nr:hypothetical protein [Effusibacillus lacus]TCS71383.1 hypothetical protein EDD64_1261 [Effusibacillus lacus]GAX89915.1 hypothetical protein EFBL_1540 [Effusibacillus lacus]
MSIKEFLKLPPKEIGNVHPSFFTKVRGEDFKKLSTEQLFALTPEQVTALNPGVLQKLSPRQLNEWLPLAHPDIKPHIEQALPKAEKLEKKQHSKSRLRKESGFVTNDVLLADVVAAKLDISVRFLLQLSDFGEFTMFKVAGTWVCDKPSLMDYLNRQRVAGAFFDNKGNPLWRNGDLVRVPLEPLTDIPVLYPVENFAEQVNCDKRTFVRKCNEGYYDYFRIGSHLKMSEDDFNRSLARKQNPENYDVSERNPLSVREKIDRTIKKVWNEDIRRECQMGTINSESILRCLWYYYLRLRLTDPYIRESGIVIDSEYHFERNRIDLVVRQGDKPLAAIELKHIKTGFQSAYKSATLNAEKYARAWKFEDCQFHLCFIIQELRNMSSKDVDFYATDVSNEWAQGKLTKMMLVLIVDTDFRDHNG